MGKKDFLKIIKQLSIERTLYIVGYGNYGKRLGSWFNNNNIIWKGFIDRNNNFNELAVNKPILGYEGPFERNAMFIISSEMHKETMISSLKKHGIDKSQIISSISRNIMYDIINETDNIKIFQERIKKCYNIHKNKRCFIVGNGPSLVLDDLNKIKHEITFGCNGIYGLYEKTEWRPTYYCATDPGGCRLYYNDLKIANLLTTGSKLLFSPILSDAFYYRNKYNNLILFKTAVPLDWNHPVFSKDISKEIFVSGTVTYAMLQIAVYMGFAEIYLLGIDFSFSVERNEKGEIKIQSFINHPKEIEEAIEPVKKVYGYEFIADIDKQLHGYQAAKQYSDAHGIKIFNATRGGKLEVFPRVDFDSLFEK